MIHTMKLSEPWYSLVKNGKKTIEMRLFDEKRQMINKYDNILFSDKDGKNIFKKFVKNLSYHKTFESALKHGKLKNILPGINTYKEGVNVYYNINNYKKNEKKYGVILIYI